MNKTTTSNAAMILVAIFGLLLAFGSVAHSQEFDAAPPAATSDLLAPELAQADAGAVEAKPDDLVKKAEDAPLDVAGEVVSNVREGDWRHAIAGLLALLMLGLGRAREHVKWFSGDRGGAVLVGLLGISGGLVTALAGNAPLDWRLFLGAMGVVWTAVGGYSWVKRLIWPKDKAEE